jgi:hypothetical protein
MKDKIKDIWNIIKGDDGYIFMSSNEVGKMLDTCYNHEEKCSHKLMMTNVRKTIGDKLDYCFLEKQVGVYMFFGEFIPEVNLKFQRIDKNGKEIKNWKKHVDTLFDGGEKRD